MTTTIRKDGVPVRPRQQLIDFIQALAETTQWPAVSADDLREILAAMQPAAPGDLREQASAIVKQLSTETLYENVERMMPYVAGYMLRHQDLRRDFAIEVAAETLASARAMQHGATAGRVDQIQRERDALATAIGEAAVKAGIARADAHLTGPHLLMLANDMAECIVAYQAPTADEWRVGEYWSSANPDKKALVLSEGTNDIKCHGAHPDFIRWIAASSTHPDVIDAARWRAFLGSARIRILGSAGIKSDTAPDGTPHNGYAHFGMEIWTKYGSSLSPEQREQMRANNESARELITKYADIARAAQAEKGGA